MRSSNIEATKRKTQSTFSETTVLQSRQSTASPHFRQTLVHSENATPRQPEIVSFAIQGNKKTTKLSSVSVSALISFILPLKGKES